MLNIFCSYNDQLPLIALLYSINFLKQIFTSPPPHHNLSRLWRKIGNKKSTQNWRKGKLHHIFNWSGYCLVSTGYQIVYLSRMRFYCENIDGQIINYAGALTSPRNINWCCSSQAHLHKDLLESNYGTLFFCHWQNCTWKIDDEG